MRKTHALAATAAVLIGGGALLALSDGAPRARRSAERATSGAPATTIVGDAAFASGGGVAALDSAAAVPGLPSRVVKTAQLDLKMTSDQSVTKATERANQIAEAHGGFVASTDTQKDEHRQATLTLRVPAGGYEAALAELRGLGKVTNESLGGRDVTSTLVDLDARLRTLRSHEEALNALILKARTVGETLEVSREAANVRMQIEQLAAQQAQLSDQADYATITLHILGPAGAIDPGTHADPLLVNSLRDALGASLAVLGGVIVLLGYLVPAAALAALGYGAWRLFGRRRPAVA